MNIYGISGLGADERVFQFLDLEIQALQWIDPLHNESLSDYAKRLSAQIDQAEEFILIGVSFGGLIAVEMNKFLNPLKVFLISSAATSGQLPVAYRLIGKTGVLKILPKSFLRPPNWLAHWLFSAKNKSLINVILKDTDLKFNKWALQQLVSWRSAAKPDNIVSIHGDSDLMIRNPGNSDYLIRGGGHFMVVDRAGELSDIIKANISR